MKSLKIVFLFIFFVNFSFAENQSKITEVLTPLVNEYISGAVTVVATKDKILDFQAVGFSNLEEKTLMKKDDLFWIASMTKPINAVAFMMLVDEGKVFLDDEVSKYIPEFKEMYVQSENGLTLAKTAITLRQLLSHSAGLVHCKTERGYDKMPLKDRMIEYAKQPLECEPNTKHIYSNTSVGVTARVIEIVSGMPYMQFMQERVFIPLEMIDTTFIPSEEQLKRLVTTYTADETDSKFVSKKIDMLTHPLSDKNRESFPGGGLFSTAYDLLNFCQMMENKGVYKGKRLLSEESVKELTSKQAPCDSYYGLSFYSPPPYYGHAGGYRTRMTTFREKGLILIYLVQCQKEFPHEGNSKAEKLFEQTAFEIYDESK